MYRRNEVRALPYARATRLGFTLVELLVVIGIIALLISILMPAMAAARAQATRTKCLSNIRSMSTAFQMYLNENKQTVVSVNWGAGTANGKVNGGWLYEASVYRGSPPLTPTEMENGKLYPYLKNKEVYRCPGHATEPLYGFTDGVTSYLMNGAINGYNAQKLYKVNQFKITDALFWEADERPYNGVPPFNDGASYPYESFDPKTPQSAGLSLRHGKYSVMGFIGGHAEVLPQADIYSAAQFTGRNFLWCAPAPDSANGH